ncbi:alpha/beta hydrolase [Amycolatopsis sp.]|jgi:pimeloyl-ACP methyl ester carboxylesterase|uniref:alpha/beta fold hydrolase n=1 Tax=Amycolatopsis sp. TaxID=37632 RepID=UPI002DFA8F28|nr:alpha/beta hydrolase [Amycolatopsis sp.]
MVNSVRSKDGTLIAYDRIGAGPAVIYVGGATSYRAFDQAGAELAKLLSLRFTVFTYDRRGRGESGDTAPYAVEREVEDLDALIGVAGGNAHLLGESSGAVLALEAAARGLAVTKLACYEPPFIVDDGRAPMPANFVDQLDGLVAANRRGDAFKLFMTVAVGLPEEMAAGVQQDPMWPALEAITHTIAYDGRVMGDTQSGDPTALARFARVAVPTLVLAGSESPEYQRNAVAVLADVLPNAESATLEGQGHQFSPAVLAPVVEEFFALLSHGLGPVRQ